jgi:hypothetical protein
VPRHKVVRFRLTQWEAIYVVLLLAVACACALITIELAWR